jgi:cytochrome b involved in lipid metabolism
VYDLSSYIGSHPGGSQALFKFKGKDATNQILGQSAHKSIPNFIRKLLQKFYVKDIQTLESNE